MTKSTFGLKSSFLDCGSMNSIFVTTLDREVTCEGSLIEINCKFLSQGERQLREFLLAYFPEVEAKLIFLFYQNKKNPGIKNNELMVYLYGKKEIPAVRTCAKAKFTHKLTCYGLKYKLAGWDLFNGIQAHLHLGSRGVNGPVVVNLNFSPKAYFGPGDFYLKGLIGQEDLEGPLKGSPLEELLHEIKQGNVYVNVHTRQHPDGEIRGQL